MFAKHIVVSYLDSFLFLKDDWKFEAFGFHFINLTISDFTGSLLQFSYDIDGEMMWDVLYIQTLIQWWKNR